MTRRHGTGARDNDGPVELWTRLEPGGRENLGAGAAALVAGAVVGTVVFYVTRILLAREPLSPVPPEERGRGEGG